MIGVPSTTSKKSSTQTYTIDYSLVSAEGIQFDGPEFEIFFLRHFKVDGKTGQLGEEVQLSTRKAEDEESAGGAGGELIIVSRRVISKRYIRSLTKRYLRASRINTKQYAPLVSVHADGSTNRLVLRYRKDLPLRPCRFCKCGNRKEDA
ncbi:hypothetical protein BCR35DRAFT_329788 [Leucosporidium creatinivorum]|uniref:Large ribosomal subunit protein eL22 n=1 Tax=Leucosporidium creatinivorum TaxID=106004 RepID=A0A1Y2FZC5_9BASI|nr:hypothetical protein BCR35DRAFT_329788 [Leucosporidium creatinivorum]